MTTKEETLSVEIYETNLGIFLKFVPPSSQHYYYNKPNPEHIKINGKLLKEYTCNKDWWHLPYISSLESVEKFYTGQSICVGRVLKNPALASSTIPLNLSLEEGKKIPSDDDDIYIFASYSLRGLESLYDDVWETSASEWRAIDTTVKSLGHLTITNYDVPEAMNVKVQINDSYGNDKTHEVDLTNVVEYSHFDEMFTPEFMLHKRPCKLSSEQSYKIVRQYIKDNIDRKQALIDSDYSFCFSINKIVETKPYPTKKEKYTPRGNSYKPPRFEHGKANTKKVSIFRMTWDRADKGKGYGDYPVIAGFEGDSLADLKLNVKAYLENLMETINTPLKECPNCSGHGVLVNKN